MAIRPFWFIPLHGDGRWLGSKEGSRPTEFSYLSQVAIAADRLGYEGVLLPTGRTCEDRWMVASALAPQIGLVEDDYSFTGGVKGETPGWSWDLSGTYGQDRTKFSTLNSANASLYTDTGFTPTDFYDGSFAATQYIVNLDIKRDVDVGFAEPLTIAFGGEYRWDRYVRQADDAL